MGHVLSTNSCGKHPRKSVTIAASGTTFDTTVNFDNEILAYFLLECYDSDGNRTRTLSIIDENSITVWTDVARNDNGNYMVPVMVTDGTNYVLGLPLSGTYTVRITLSGAAGGTGGTDYITLFVI